MKTDIKYIFAYGSLMCPDSCFRTIKRNVSYIPATLQGYERKFNAVGSVFHNDSQRNIGARFANLIENKNSNCLGLLFEITDLELEELIKRENFYNLLDVSHFIDNPPGRVFTFICTKSSLLEESYVLQTYVNLMLLASKKFPLLIAQIEQEYQLLKPQEIIKGGFLSITGKY